VAAEQATQRLLHPLKRKQIKNTVQNFPSYSKGFVCGCRFRSSEM